MQAKRSELLQKLAVANRQRHHRDTDDRDAERQKRDDTTEEEIANEWKHGSTARVYTLAYLRTSTRKGVRKRNYASAQSSKPTQAQWIDALKNEARREASKQT